MLIRQAFNTIAVLLLVLASVSAGMAVAGEVCGDGAGICRGGGVSVNTGGNANGAGGSKGGGNCILDETGRSSALADLNADEIDALLFMREEEKLARDSYLALGDLWDLLIFGNIAKSEQNHMDALKSLIDCYGLTDPVMDVAGIFFNSELQTLFNDLMAEGEKSMMDGLYVGALIEETDMEDIQSAIDVTDHLDIIGTYESLMCGSRNHLRAFIRQIEINGGSYIPAVLEPEEFWAIAYSDMEQDCWNK
jgi:hypothetical protein